MWPRRRRKSTELQSEWLWENRKERKKERLNGEKDEKMKARIETAKNMLKDKMDKKTIIKYTGLTLKELEKITV